MKKVLVCDSDESARYIMTFALTGLNWEVITYEDCDSITEKIMEHQASVIIINSHIPNAGGISVIQTLKANPAVKNTQIILCTSDFEFNELANEVGFDFHLLKPVDINKLEIIMKNAYASFLSSNFGENSLGISKMA